MSSLNLFESHPTHASRAGLAHAKEKLTWNEIGIFPLLISMPFMYYPKVFEGDTQPWVLIGALIALATFRTQRFIQRNDIGLILLATLCILVYAARSSLGVDLLRAAYTQVTFVCLWLVARRERSEYFPSAVRLTIIVWFIVGVYQYTSVAMSIPIEIAGRYVEGRSGVPSLTSEPSTYGSLSMLQMMYLLSQRRATNNIYIACAAASVVISGSLLALVLLIFPAMKLKGRTQLLLALALPLIIVADYSLTSAGLTARLLDLGTPASSVASVLFDPSLNLRFGHVYFTLFEHFTDSLLLLHSVNFMQEYNEFAAASPIFIETGSNFILPAVGELIYGSGIFGAILLFAFILKSQALSDTGAQKFTKVAFIIACMLNPISMSNVFLIVYATQQD